MEGQWGRGRALDNVLVERLWRSVKWEEVYLKDYQTAAEAASGLANYFRFCNHERLHQALAYQTPALVYGLAALCATMTPRHVYVAEVDGDGEAIGVARSP